jgi:hypothetical protein
VTVALLSTAHIYTFGSSPGLKGYVRYCYHLGSVVVVRKLLHLNLLLGNYWVNWNQLGRNVYFDGPLKVHVFLLMRNTQKKQEAQRCILFLFVERLFSINLGGFFFSMFLTQVWSLTSRYLFLYLFIYQIINSIFCLFYSYIESNKTLYICTIYRL